MQEQKIVKKQLIKNMFFTFLVFTLLFLLFDLLIYNQISISLFRNIDEELLSSQKNDEQKEISKNVKSSLQETQTQKNSKEETATELENQINKPNPLEKRLNPRLINIVRDTNGNITNQESIGRFYEDYLTNITFDKTNLETIYSIKINNEYNYRGITFTKTQNGELTYIQLLANVDGEMQTLQNVARTLFLGTVIIVAISVLASYILSKRMMKPIMEAYDKQTEFVQNASHELRTPLTIIQAKQELLLQEPNKKIIEKSEDIHLMLKETRRLTKLIKELMILARVDSNHYEIKKENTDIDQLIKEITVPYADFAKVENKKLILDLKYGKNSYIDRNKFNELLIILLDNAIKYTLENGTVTVKTYTEGNKCILEVLDDGIGISEEGLKHIFERFYREDKARSRQTGGNGLGLSIAHTIVTAHGGTIKITHNEPKGTKVIVKI